jgi:chemosensory pili system protein ChpA (sensor histidine kinase/response regulator)
MQPASTSTSDQIPRSPHAAQIQAIETLLPAIQEHFDQLRGLLETMGRGDVTVEALDTLRQGWQQLRDTFYFAGLRGPAYSAGQALVALTACAHPDAYADNLGDALAGLLVALSAYLALRARGEPECPALLVFPINALRLATHRPTVCAAEVFALTGGADLIIQTGPDTTETNRAVIRSLAQRYRSGVMHATVSALRDDDWAQPLKGLVRVAEKLQHAASTPAVARSWWILGGLLMALAEGSVSRSEVRPIVLRIERMLGGLADTGETAEMQDTHRHVAAQALYLLARSPSLVADEAKAVTQTYDLSAWIVSPEEQERLRLALGDASSEAIEGVTRTIREDLQMVKESLDVLSRSAHPPAEELKVLAGITSDLCGTLAILDRPDLMHEMALASTRLERWMERERVPEAEWSELAQSVLRVEATLAGLSESSPQPDGTVDALLRQAVIHEALVDLRRVMGHLEANDPLVAHETVTGDLAGIGAALAMAGMSQMAAHFNQLAGVLGDWRRGSSSLDEALAAALESLMLALEQAEESTLGDPAAQQRAGMMVKRFVEALTPAPRAQQVASSAGADAASAHTGTLDLSAIFVEEAEEIMARIEPALAAWQQDRIDRAALADLRRAFHTLKGSGRMAGAEAIGELAWGIERVLNQVIEREDPVDDEVVMTVVEGTAHLTAHLPELQRPLSGEAQSCLDRLAMMPSRQDAAEGQSPPGTEDVSATSESVAMPVLAAESDSGQHSKIDAEVRTSPTIMADGALPEPSIDGVDGVQDEDATDLWTLFEHEAMAYLSRIQSYLQQAGENAALPLDSDVLRAFHTLKGTARTVGLDALAQWADEIDGWAKAAQRADKPLMQGQIAILGEATEACRQAVRTAIDPSIEVAWLQRLRRDRERLEQQMSVEPADPEIRALFLEESAELLAHIDDLFGVDPKADRAIPVDALMGALHTFKGGARMAGALLLGDLAHAIESYLARLRPVEEEMPREAHALLRQAVDALQGQLDQWAEGLPVELPRDLLEKLGVASEIISTTGTQRSVDERSDQDGGSLDVSGRHAADEPGGPQPVVAEDAASVSESGGRFDAASSTLPDWWDAPLPGETEDAPIVSEQLRVSSQTLDRLLGLMGELLVANGRAEQPIRELAGYIREIARTIDRLHRQLRELEIEAESRIVFRPEDGKEAASKADFDPLELDRYSRLQHLSRGLGESMTDLVSLHELVNGAQQAAESALQHQHRLAGGIQQNLLHTRMVAFDFHSARLRRVVRQSAEALGKSAVLEIRGGETELDRQVLDRMVAPLEHLLRNALAHGIEPEEERQRLGKPVPGRIQLGVHREGSQILLEIADDGYGLNTRAILSRARARGLVEPDETLTDTQIHHLILAPGLSTATEVSQIAGRGVGMDVVNSQIKACGGRLEITSQMGLGSRFRIWLPYTLAVSDCLLVQVGDESYAVPMSGIQGIIRMDPAQVAEWQAGQIDRLSHLDAEYQLMTLAQLLGRHQSSREQLSGERAALLVNVAGRHWALVADGLVGTQELVVRPVGTRLATVPGITGAAILSDGLVVLILDPQSLIGNRHRTAAAEIPEGSPQMPQSAGRALQVMVVDDSITMRRVTARLLAREGMIATTARDGIDALQKMHEQAPDLILLDVEMPRMDGFELLTNLKADDALQAIPVVMITSRIGEKHRDRALALGAADYLGKPYQEAELLATIARHAAPVALAVSEEGAEG